MVLRFITLSAALLSVSACGSDSGANANASAQETVKLSGETLYNQCRACHTIAKGEDAIIGPNLWGIIGSEIAAKTDFTYSKALSAKEGVWDKAAMDAFIKSPQGFAPGNRMSFSGIKDADKRAALIEYMAQQSD